MSVFELGEYECTFGDVADFAWARGDVVEDAPAACKEGEAAFAEAAERPQEQVVGTVADAEWAAVGGLLDGSVDAGPSAFVARVSQARQPLGGESVEDTERVLLRADQVAPIRVPVNGRVPGR
ncbi:hypothetical protein [Streptosporangium longisporum]|uniref:hypothetical protein n=1 Tax=Streptosporangium longisporum TaxID=46187 RepID=UPI0031E709D5